MEAGLEWIETTSIIDMVADVADEKDVRLQLSDEKPQTMRFIINDDKSGSQYRVNVVSRRVGEDSGRDILLNLSGQLKALREGQRGTSRRVSPDEFRKLREIQKGFEQRPHNPSDYVAV